MAGFVFYDGPSMLDGAPIIGIAITRSTNIKTGDMVQTYILRADQSPLDAIASGDDASICGDCRHRGDRAAGRGRSCYVQVGRAPMGIFGAWIRGAYPLVSPADGAQLIAGRKVRLGAYGDPAAIPGEAWRALVSLAIGTTGYSHAWRDALADSLRPLIMASVDTAAEALHARAQGWRTFRVRIASEPLLRREMVCPASAEGGKRAQCADCLACDGSERAHRASVAIIAHGALARHFAPV